MERLAEFVYRWAGAIIALVIILNLAALTSFVRFSLDTDFLGFFSRGNPRAEEFQQINEEYQSGETISLLVEQDGSLLKKENLVAVLNFQEKISRLDGIAGVQSFLPPEVLTPRGLISVGQHFLEQNYVLLRDFLENRYFLRDQFLSADGRKGLLLVSLKPDAPAGEVLGGLKEVIKDEDRLTLSLAGNEIIKDTLRHYLMRVLLIIPPCAIVLVLLVFFLMLRSRRFTALAMLPAAFAALWTFGTIFWSGQRLNLVTVISPLFVIVIGSAYGLHYVSHFSENLRQCPERRELTMETLRMVGPPILLATVTTMAGFASLTWSKVLPMREMGLFVTLGIGYAGFLALFFLPALLSRMRLPSKVPQPRESLVRLIQAASRRRALVIGSFLVIVGVSAFYLPRLEVVSNQLMFFKEGSEIRQTFARVEEHFGGAFPLTGEIISEKGLADLSDYQFASQVLATERELERLPGIKSAFSIFDLVQGINQMLTGQQTYPQDPALIQGLLMQLDGEALKTWASSDGFRMMIRTQELSSGDLDKLKAFVAEHQEIIRMITGMPVLFDEMNKLVVRSQIQSLGLALLLIFLMLWLTLKRLSTALLGLLPIAITIVAILGLLSVTGFNLNIMTANLSAIAIGVGVDYSIHLLLALNHFRKLGLDKREACESALASISQPVLANAFGLAIGFSALFFSPLRVHFQVASVMWVAMVVSSMAALLLIPALHLGGAAGRTSTGN